MAEKDTAATALVDSYATKAAKQPASYAFYHCLIIYMPTYLRIYNYYYVYAQIFAKRKISPFLCDVGEKFFSVLANNNLM